MPLSDDDLDWLTWIEWAARYGGHGTSAGWCSAALGGRIVFRFLLVKTGPIGSDLNDIGVASNAPVEVNKNNSGAET